MELHLNIIGVLLMLLALIHIPFPKYFKWKEELSSLSLINKQMMEVHTFFIGLTVFLMGILSFTMANELVNTYFGRIISLGMGIFWGFRLVFQLFVYSPKLWKGRTFETVIHIIFTLLWIYLSFVYLKIFFDPAT
jgi:hypothetical protein